MNTPDPLDDGKPDGESRVARGYRFKPEAKGKRFKDARGRTYGIDQKGANGRTG